MSKIKIYTRMLYNKTVNLPPAQVTWQVLDILFKPFGLFALGDIWLSNILSFSVHDEGDSRRMSSTLN